MYERILISNDFFTSQAYQSRVCVRSHFYPRLARASVGPLLLLAAAGATLNPIRLGRVAPRSFVRCSFTASDTAHTVVSTQSSAAAISHSVHHFSHHLTHPVTPEQSPLSSQPQYSTRQRMLCIIMSHYSVSRVWADFALISKSRFPRKFVVCTTHYGSRSRSNRVRHFEISASFSRYFCCIRRVRFSRTPYTGGVTAIPVYQYPKEYRCDFLT